MGSGKTVDYKVYKGSKDGKIIEATNKREIKTGQVLIKITHSGLCGTDVHYKSADMALGHEGVGVVKEVGEGVKLVKQYAITVSFLSRDPNS